MRLGIIITQTESETVFNALRLALYSLGQGDTVRIFLSGKGVDFAGAGTAQFDTAAQARKVLEAGGLFYACGSCLKLRGLEGSEICPLSTLSDQYEIVRDSDRLVTI